MGYFLEEATESINIMTERKDGSCILTERKDGLMNFGYDSPVCLCYFVIMDD